MRSLGHNVTFVAPGASTAQGLRRLTNGTFEAAGEPRQKNSAGFAVCWEGKGVDGWMDLLKGVSFFLTSPHLTSLPHLVA